MYHTHTQMEKKFNNSGLKNPGQTNKCSHQFFEFFQIFFDKILVGYISFFKWRITVSGYFFLFVLNKMNKEKHC